MANKSKVIVSVIALTMLAFPAGIACAAEMHPAEGGTWQYGTCATDKSMVELLASEPGPRFDS